MLSTIVTLVLMLVLILIPLLIPAAVTAIHALTQLRGNRTHTRIQNHRVGHSAAPAQAFN